ncbi:hypothetical protein FQA39_LY01229 [Lamprigera yunnana]|nr:hypothetical protein FQA39_LY01229 [Lamprigera yunnana]
MKSKIKQDEKSALLGDQLRPEQEIEPWDVFKDPPVKIATGSMEESKLLDKTVKLFKLLIYLLTFSTVLGSAVISKGTLLFMTSQIQPNQTKHYCKDYIDRNKEYVVELPRVERIAWIWVIVFAFFVPEVMTFLRSIRICLFKSWIVPSKSEVFSLLLTETLPTIGSAILVFSILPELDVVKGVMLTNAVCFVPAVIGFFSRSPSEKDHTIKFALDILCIFAQASAFIVWPMIENKPTLWLIPLAVFLISCGWWENYVSEGSPIKFLDRLAKSKKTFENSRYFVYIFLSIWKCIVFLVSTIIIIYVKEKSVLFLFTDFVDAFKQHPINVTETKSLIGDMIDFTIGEEEKIIYSDNLTPVWVFLINIVSSYLCYVFGKFACKILIQGFSYAFPVNLAVPTTISVLIAVCGIYNGNPCIFYPTIPLYLFFNNPTHSLKAFIAGQHVWIWVLWLLSQSWITLHMWVPKCERLARTEKLYVRPMYDAFLIDQSIALNRRRDDLPEKMEDDDDAENDDDISINERSTPDSSQNKCGTTTIYACGTMWHETKEEMLEFLKSIFRLDEDQCARRLVKEKLEFDMSDYYELETHIFFDDAFIRKHKNDNDPMVNEYVKTLVMAVDEAASEVHQTHFRVRPPKKYVTPYGGRLEWVLPGKTLMTAHLKDRKKIRPKKRWSQVMYMYYLLGHRLMENEKLSPKEKDVVAENTYLLALDGDIDFQPDAVRLLVDLMKKNKALGAACGRIHPLGSGPMVWYQMFEYAIGHWLQKATEHMIGCVLCSPGCFSLFRAKALTDDSVMRKYTTRSQQARHFVQYDQGEDRWLCTLLLQRGYRVEYSAASDAYTHCPEGFNEFYNQRRRWIPSTTANILDLLMNYKRTIKINDNISKLYILYQIVLMVGTILGPGTIFLMLVGAFVAAFQLDQWSSFLWNVIPILIFLVVCVLFKSDIQLLFAGIISAVYGLIMMAVLVGVMLQISTDGVLAPSSLFFFCVAGEMIATAFFHPKELGCLVYGVVYYVTVPSMYMLLIIYCVFNLNDISWGTRDVTIVPQKKEAVEDTKKDEKTQNKVFSLFGGDKDENSGSFEISFAGLFKCLLCTHSSNGEENMQLVQIIDNLKQLSEKINSLELSLYKSNNNFPEVSFTQQPQRRTTVLEGSKGKEVKFRDTDSSSEHDQKSLLSEILEEEEEELNNWIEEDKLGRGDYGCISTKEKVFWEGLLNKYLHPIEDNKKQVAKDLKDLRDKSVLAFFMINALFVLVVFLLTLKKELLHVEWPLDVKYNFTYRSDRREIELSETRLELEPIGFVFLIFFFSLLVIQFIGMIFHRFSTFSQILSTTYINWNYFSEMKRENLTEDEILARNPVKIVKQWMKLKGSNDDVDEDDYKKELPVERRKTVKHLAEGTHKENSLNDLEAAFEKRTATSKTSRKSMAIAINKRRSTVMQRRSTVMQRRSTQYNLHKGYTNKGFVE